MECQIDGEPRNVVHINIVLIRANSPEDAFAKAEQLGKEQEDSYLNYRNQKTTWVYRGLRDLNLIHDELEHGAELMYEEKINVSEAAIQNIITAKPQLNVFCPDETRDLSIPDYGCKEIMEQALKIIHNEAKERSDSGMDENI